MEVRKPSNFFQSILHAYEVAGKACEDIIYEDDDQEDLLARKMFKQFSFSSVTENTTTFTIKTEVSLNVLWNQVLETNFGKPDNLGVHGLKYTAEVIFDNKHYNVSSPYTRKARCLSRPRVTSYS